MKYRRIIKLIYMGLILLLIGLLAQRVYIDREEKEDNQAVNQLRVIINPIYQSIREADEIVDYDTIINEAIEVDDGILITVIDLTGKVITTSNEELLVGDILFLDHMLYMDESYLTTNIDYFKLSMPLYRQGKVNGFAIFEIERDQIKVTQFSGLFSTTNTINYMIGIVVILLCLFAGRLVFYENKKELLPLKEGFQAIARGTIEPIKVNEYNNYQDLYHQYNSLVEELRYIIKKQAVADRNRKVFLTTISHELKTPIATINAYIEGLMRGVAKDDEARESYQQIIYDKMQQLTKQIEELFKYAQEESGRFKYNFEECYGDELFGAIFETLSSSKSHDTQIENLIPKCIINVDKTRIEQVVTNLYNNAVKHSNKIEVIKLYACRQDQDIIIEVSDSGQGIDPKDMPHIFDYYYQGETSKEKDYEGIGLGLAICKDIMDKHKGRIRVKSIVGKGSTFTIQIPIV